MEGALTQIAAEETELVTVVGEIVTLFEAEQTKLGELETKIANGQTVDPAEVEAVKLNLGDSIAKLKALLPTPAPSGGGTPTAPTKSVYVFTGEGTPDPSVWSPSGFETVPAAGETAKPLFYFSGDTTPTDTNGNGQPGWTQYTGAVQPIPAA